MRSWIGAGAAATLVVATANVEAGGLFIPGAGPQAQARAGAFVAKADDPTALFHNPAGFAKHSGTVIQLGASFVDLSLRYQKAGNYRVPAGESLSYGGQPYPLAVDRSKPALGIGGFQALPVLAISTDFGLGARGIPVRFGLGVVPPQAFPERNFDTGYQFEANADEPPPPQRYDTIKQKASVILPTLAVAYRISSKLEVGAKLSVGFAELEGHTHSWGIANYAGWIARDSEFKVETRDNFVPQYGIGVLYRPARNLELGASYTSEARIEARGTGSTRLGSDLGTGPNDPATVVPNNDTPLCAAGGTSMQDLRACVTFTVPQMATVGARYIVRDSGGAERADLELDVRWENWKAADRIHVIVDGISLPSGRYLEPTEIRNGAQDVFSFRLGGSYTIPLRSSRLQLRAGAAYDTRTTPGSWARVNFDGAPRTTIAGGVAYRFGRYQIELGGGVVLEPVRKVADDCTTSITEPGCAGNGMETPVRDRTRPDPIQPTTAALNQIEAPFNAGVYESGYVLLHVAFSARL